MKSAETIFHAFEQTFAAVASAQSPQDFMRWNSDPVSRKHVISYQYTENLAQMNGIGESKTIEMDVSNSSENDDLLRAIELSKQVFEPQSSSSVNVCAVSSITTDDNEHVQDNIYSACHWLLCSLTKASVLEKIAENWRKSDAILWLLMKLSELDLAITSLFIVRELIAGLIDIFLADQSESADVLYDKKSHKFALSSYQSVYPINEAGDLCSAAKSLPDWSNLLEIVSRVLSNAGRHHNIHGRYLTMPPISSYDEAALICKTFYATCLKQSRYSTQLISIIQHVASTNFVNSDMIAEAIFEAIPTATVESTAHIFRVLEGFLAINDKFSFQRHSKLFTPSNMSILDLLSQLKDQPSRVNFVLVCLRSVLYLFRCSPSSINIFRDILNNSLPRVKLWAPWMLKFCFQHMNKLTKDHEAQLQQQSIIHSTNPHNASSAMPPLKGPFILVHGERQEDVEQTWARRAEQTFAMLQEYLAFLGADANELMPIDAFNETTHISDDGLPALISVGPEESLTATTATVVGNGDNYLDLTNADSLGLADGMTDEQLEKILASLT